MKAVTVIVMPAHDSEKRRNGGRLFDAGGCSMSKTGTASRAAPTIWKPTTGGDLVDIVSPDRTRGTRATNTCAVNT